MLQLIQQELRDKGVADENLIAYNFEDMKVRELKDPEKLHDTVLARIKGVSGRTYLFLDEIQEVDRWETCVNSLRMNSDVDIYITGSNAKMLASEYATLIAGRYVEIRVYPFSFTEFGLAIREREPEIADTALFLKYLRFGGMPSLIHLGLDEVDAKQYLNDVFASVVIKDIMKRNGFRDVDLLERIIIYVMANVGKTFSATSISKFFKSEKRTIATETVLNYLKGCEDAYLFGKVSRLDVPGKKLLQVNEKYYIVDHGLREAVYGNNERDIELVLENMVYLEILRHGYKVTVGRVGNREIDFVCDKAGKRIYVQVCYLIANDDVAEREFGVYYEIPDNFPKYVVSMDEIDMSRNGILHKNVREFLQMAEY
jgi:predicted AAA+ superfamily ATPase